MASDDDDKKADEVAKAKEDGIRTGMKGGSVSTFLDSPQESAARKEGEALGKAAQKDEDKD